MEPPFYSIAATVDQLHTFSRFILSPEQSPELARLMERLDEVKKGQEKCHIPIRAARSWRGMTIGAQMIGTPPPLRAQGVFALTIEQYDKIVKGDHIKGVSIICVGYNLEPPKIPRA